MSLAANHCLFVGNVASEPRFKPSDGTKTSQLFFTLAVARPKKFEGAYPVDYVCCMARGRAAEDGQRYITKGKQLVVTGALNLYKEKKCGVETGAEKHVIAVQHINYGPDSRAVREARTNTVTQLDANGIEVGDFSE
jgi:single-stranded DNA-binding protein